LGSAFLAGVVAGYGVAIPVGAIAVLIVDTALRRGLQIGLAAGAGAATADGAYALVAAVAGTAIAGAIAPIVVPLRWLSVVVLGVIAARGLNTLRRAVATGGAAGGDAGGGEPGPSGTYARFVGLTIINPTTVVYFAALILGLPALGSETGERAAFVAGALLASISWQSLLAVVGSLAHRRLPPSARTATSLVGNLIVLGLALNIARGLVAGGG
jgi:arginine exporter protein ArgO